MAGKWPQVPRAAPVGFPEGHRDIWHTPDTTPTSAARLRPANSPALPFNHSLQLTSICSANMYSCFPDFSIKTSGFTTNIFRLPLSVLVELTCAAHDDECLRLPPHVWYP